MATEKSETGLKTRHVFLDTEVYRRLFAELQRQSVAGLQPHWMENAADRLFS